MFIYYLGDSGKQEHLSRCNLNTSDLWRAESMNVELVGPGNPRPMLSFIAMDILQHIHCRLEETLYTRVCGKVTSVPSGC